MHVVPHQLYLLAKLVVYVGIY
ncbi:hypothetical protein Zm00014a_013352 [Zea mays]|uniref:Uncharacterized protein n=1 Tax=Zea mays TaxID=4577 RepID=A0A3L6FWJ5_MAIZE|nr:hypothetical protein Zm00014a_013352 [Zea mays]